jgi:glycosyltransferase involved in cell wall biosynthesis
MAAGLPVVVSDIGQLSHLVSHGKTGWLCPPGDEVALADALEQLWLFPDLRERLGQAGAAIHPGPSHLGEGGRADFGDGI